MSIEAALFGYLSGGSPVGGIVGARIYPMIMPQQLQGDPSALPCIIYQRLSTDRQQKFCGTDGLVRSLFQLTLYADTFAATVTLAEQTRRALIDFGGYMGSVRVRKVFLDDTWGALEPEPGLFGAVQRFVVWHDETP